MELECTAAVPGLPKNDGGGCGGGCDGDDDGAAAFFAILLFIFLYRCF